MIAHALLLCPCCGEEAPFRMSWSVDKTTYAVDGVAIPFTPELTVELKRRGFAALCQKCWQAGAPPKILVPERYAS